MERWRDDQWRYYREIRRWTDEEMRNAKIKRDGERWRDKEMDGWMKRWRPVMWCYFVQ